MFLELHFLLSLAAFHHFSHFVDRNHPNWAHVNSTQALQDFLNMLNLVGFTVDDACWELALEYLQHIQRVAHVQKLNQFVGDPENKLSLLARNDTDPPQLRILDGR